MYNVDIYPSPYDNELEYKYAGRFGAKGEKRKKKKKPTPAQVAYQNWRHKINLIRRTIKLNYYEHDLWVRLSYQRGERKGMGEVKGDFKKFYEKLGRRYKKLGVELKWIRVIEIGKRGGIHVHVLINRIPGADTDVMIAECWPHGYTHYTNLHNSGGFQGLAEYMAKQPDEEEREEKGLPPKLTKEEYSYSTSRNLIRPSPIRKTYYHWTMRRILKDGPKPTPGYYIDKSTLEMGVNPYTGYPYLRYTEVKLNRRI
ncbi:MAG: hypothetical protein K2N01_12880 [Lachnospiraceae bacterium]|nr:hypothetical protein [Lachnospiraceae bacterium]